MSSTTLSDAAAVSFGNFQESQAGPGEMPFLAHRCPSRSISSWSAPKRCVARSIATSTTIRSRGRLVALPLPPIARFLDCSSFDLTCSRCFNIRGLVGLRAGSSRDALGGRPVGRHALGRLADRSVNLGRANLAAADFACVQFRSMPVASVPTGRVIDGDRCGRGVRGRSAGSRSRRGFAGRGTPRVARLSWRQHAWRR